MDFTITRQPPLLYFLSSAPLTGFSVTLESKEVFTSDPGDMGRMETQWTLHLGIASAGGPGGGKSDFLHKGNTLPESIETPLKMLLPLWNDTGSYRWAEIRDVLHALDEPLRSSMVRFTSNVFAQKWALGRGECGRDPDPDHFTYPIRDREADRLEEWDFVVDQIRDDVMKELGLGPKHGFSWHTGCGVSQDVWEAEYRAYLDSPKSLEDHDQIEAELARRGIDASNPPPDFEGSVPGEGSFHSYAELHAKYGGDAWIHFGNVWEERWGIHALRTRLETEVER